MKRRSRLGRLGLVLLIVFAALIFIGVLSLSDNTSSTDNSAGASPSSSAASSNQAATAQASTTQPSTAPTEAELKDADYLDKKYWIQAESACEVGADDYLRRVSKYDFAWDKTGFLESKFDSYSRTVKRPGILTVVTNKVKLSNGFGAFEHVALLCDYDTQAPDTPDDVSYSILPSADGQ